MCIGDRVVFTFITIDMKSIMLIMKYIIDILLPPSSLHVSTVSTNMSLKRDETLSHISLTPVSSLSNTQNIMLLWLTVLLCILLVNPASAVAASSSESSETGYLRRSKTVWLYGQDTNASAPVQEYMGDETKRFGALRCYAYKYQHQATFLYFMLYHHSSTTQVPNFVMELGLYT
jgi:hypothetical protein